MSPAVGPRGDPSGDGRPRAAPAPAPDQRVWAPSTTRGRPAGPVTGNDTTTAPGSQQQPAEPLLPSAVDPCASPGLRTRSTAVERPARRGPADPLVFYVH